MSDTDNSRAAHSPQSAADSTTSHQSDANMALSSVALQGDAPDGYIALQDLNGRTFFVPQYLVDPMKLELEHQESEQSHHLKTYRGQVSSQTHLREASNLTPHSRHHHLIQMPRRYPSREVM